MTAQQAGATVKEAPKRTPTEEERLENARLQQQLEENRRKQQEAARVGAAPIPAAVAAAKTQPQPLVGVNRHNVAYGVVALLWSISFANTLVCWQSIVKPDSIAPWIIVMLVAAVSQAVFTFFQFHWMRRLENPYFVNRNYRYIAKWVGPLAIFLDVLTNFDGSYHNLPFVWERFPAFQDFWQAAGVATVPPLTGFWLIIAAFIASVIVAVAPEAGFIYVERR